LSGLLCLKELPALLGRRAVLLGAIAGQILALVLFAVAGSFALIAVGRVLQGLASGAALGTLSAAMVESDAERGTVASAASPGAGSGSGALLSGLLVQFLPDPRQTIYLILAAILTTQALFVLRVMPRRQRRPLSWKAVSPQVAVPADAKTTFMSTAPVVFAVWGLSGFYAALSPALYGALSRSNSVWQSALPLFALLAAATATTIVLRRLNGRAQTIIGAVAMLVGLGITVAAIESGSTWLYLVASAVAGVGFGAGFQGPMRSMAPQAADDQRQALLSAVFLVAYVGLGLSAVIPGALISSGAALTTVAIALAAALAALTAPALYAATRGRAAHKIS
jgi:MFS family permease